MFKFSIRILNPPCLSFSYIYWMGSLRLNSLEGSELGQIAVLEEAQRAHELST